MTIEQRDSPPNGSFIAVENDVKAGMLSYSWSGEDTLIIQHTEVDPAFSGKGVGKQLVLATVEYSRNNGLKILVRCPFAKRVFERHPELQDVLRLAL